MLPSTISSARPYISKAADGRKGDILLRIRRRNVIIQAIDKAKQILVSK